MERELTTRDLASGGRTEDGGAADEPLARERGGDEATGRGDEQREPLFPRERTAEVTSRWQTIQTDFVDAPRESVRQADALVADVMQQLASSFAEEREQLERQWDRGDEVTTEDLRVALTRYRSFFERLLDA